MLIEHTQLPRITFTVLCFVVGARGPTGNIGATGKHAKNGGLCFVMLLYVVTMLLSLCCCGIFCLLCFASYEQYVVHLGNSIVVDLVFVSYRGAQPATTKHYIIYE